MTNKKIQKYITFFSLLAILVIPVFCFAVDENIFQLPSTPDLKNITIPNFFLWAYRFLMAVGFASVFIALAISGVLYVFSPISVNIRAKSKDWAYGAISGFMILMLIFLILNTINSDLTLFGFKAKKIEVPTLKDEKNIIHGVYFFEDGGCGGNKPFAANSNVSNFGSITKKSMEGVKIVQDEKNNIYHIAVIYDTPNYVGKCQYIQPDDGCQSVSIGKIGSASIYKYSFTSTGTVTFYRNAGFKEDGGYLKVNASTIDGLYDKKLTDLHFTGNNPESENEDDCTVPKKDQDCIKWDKTGKCTQKQCPNLAGKNIGSIQIDGNYFVLLSYWGDKDTPTVQTFCQAYPKDDEKSRIGPKQVKWDRINNSPDFFANNVTIISVESK